MDANQTKTAGAGRTYCGAEANKSGAHRRLLVTLAVLLGLSLVMLMPFKAAASEWVLKRVTGVAYLVAPQVPAFRAKSGMVLQKGMTLATRGGARVMIARGTETILVGPGTTFALSRYRSDGEKTTLLQKTGSLTVDVAKRDRPHFTVETPFLAAVVKGTRFEVTVAGKGASVSVDRGLVSVSDYASGDQADLGPGQRASTAPEQKVGLTVGGKTMPTVRSGPKKSPSFQTPAVKNVPAATKASSNANAAANSNSGGNGKGNSGNSNAGGNGNSGNSNAGGNGNGNSGNSNAGGNGNGNSGNSNAGGNGNGNSGNSNAGGNGNGNGNGNAE